MVPSESNVMLFLLLSTDLLNDVNQLHECDI
jgi:hypothetical protein